MAGKLKKIGNSNRNKDKKPLTESESGVNLKVQFLIKAILRL